MNQGTRRKARFGSLVRVLSVLVAGVFLLAGAAFAGSTLAFNATAAGDTAVSGKVTLDASATLGSGHTYTVDGGSAQALTVAGDGTFSVSVAALADGSHTIAVTVQVDPDGAGAAAASGLTASKTVTVEGGVVATMLNLNLDMAQIWTYTQSIWDALSPLAYLGAGVGLGFMVVGYVRRVF